MWTPLLLTGLALLLLACGQGEGDVSALEVGRCLDEPGERTGIEEVELVSCDEPHDFEVFALVDLPEGMYPGDSEVVDRAKDACRDRFAAYVGVEESASALATGFLAPSEGGWEGGDRQVVCLLYEPDQRLEGPMRGAQR
ncbi:MAG: hypothetical protein EA387_05445 [Nitriliruptor sp.]|nr:MAG: hypothetical protein EA387_05445 [Nitriliruptor sp.]